MKKHILILLSLITLTILPVYSAPDEQSQEPEAIQDEIQEDTEEETEATAEDSNEDVQESQDTEEAPNAEGDELEVITKTEKNSENCCQVSITAKMPEEFKLDYFIEFQNKLTMQTYRMIGYHDNDYVSYMFVPAGSYYVNEVSVWGDNTSKYPMVLPEDFTVAENENVCLETTLVNYDAIESEAKERLGIGEESNLTESDLYTSVMPWYRPIHTGTGSNNVVRTGIATEALDIVIKIAKSGSINEAEMQISHDGGTTFSENILVPSSYEITYIDEKGKKHETGIKISFPNTKTDLLVEGDTYEFLTECEYSVSRNCVGSGYMRAYSSGITPADITLFVLFKSTGKPGEATFTYSYNGAGGPFNPNIKTVPEDGIFKIENVGITLEFHCDGEFKVGDNYEISIPKTKIKKNYTIPVMIFIAVVAVFLIFAYMFLLSFRETNQNYTLSEYQPVTIPEKTHRKKRNKAKKE